VSKCARDEYGESVRKKNLTDGIAPGTDEPAKVRGGQLASKVGNGEQMRGMVPGLGSVSGCPRPTPRQRRRGAYGHKCMQVS
jgi:hypothetical protein